MFRQLSAKIGQMPPRKLAVPTTDTDPFRPEPGRPLRIRSRSLPADSHFQPHSHPWAQLAYCSSGVLLVSAAAAGGDEVTYIVPPSRAVWIAPRAMHWVDVVEDAQFRTLYIHPTAVPAGWDSSRVIVVSPLLRELVLALDALPEDASGGGREALLAPLVLDEITRADRQALGVPLPAPGGDKRLRALCEAVLRAPGERATLAQWADQVGASERTLARLFRDELGTTYQQWRQQAILAHALPMLARGMPVSHVAAASGYASDSAFTTMFKGAMGQPPSAFQRGVS
jgi:AraC-like DNA-binding protein/quercetin dioxygenase-like cupin family protein